MELSPEPFGKKQRKPGRPPSLTDAELANRRDTLASIFEVQWADFAWEFGQARKPEAVSKAFRLLAEFKNPVVSLLLELPSQASTERLRERRQELCEVSDQLSRAHRAFEPESKRLDRIEEAYSEACRRVSEATEPKEKRIHKMTAQTVLTDLEHAKVRWEDAKVRIAQTEKKQTELETLLRAQEASFAHRELRRFLNSRRYSLTPLNLASALAGVPYIGWCQSLRRCAKLQHTVQPSLRYTVFEIVRQILEKEQPRYTKEVVQVFRESIAKFSSEPDSVWELLGEDWAYLEAAIGEAWKPGDPVDARPFRITAAYFRRVYQPRTALDGYLAERQRI